MTCLKCGKKVKEEQVFCDSCLQGMENYPVKPDIHVQLPNRADPSPAKQRKRRAPSPEEQVEALRRSRRRWMVLTSLLLVLLVVIGALLVQSLGRQEGVEWGKNYTFENPFD